MENKYFKQKYTEISQTVSEEIKTLDKYFEDYFVSQKNEDKKNQILPILNEFLSKKGKRIRSLLIFLTTKAMNKEITGCHYKLALCDELIHNATLIHDDIIDCSLYRRGFKTLNFDYDSKLAVLAGDYLLCEVLKTLASYNDERIRKLHSSTLSEMIKGELHQYFNRFKISKIDEYIEKSKNKTAKLFEAGILSSAYLNNCSEEEIQHLSNFALNFGIAFQIQNDLDNFNNRISNFFLSNCNESICSTCPLYFMKSVKQFLLVSIPSYIINGRLKRIMQMKKILISFPTFVMFCMNGSSVFPRVRLPAANPFWTEFRLSKNVASFSSPLHSSPRSPLERVLESKPPPK